MTIHEYQTNRWSFPINELTKEIDRQLVELWKTQNRIKKYSPANEYKIANMIRKIEDLLKQLEML